MKRSTMAGDARSKRDRVRAGVHDGTKGWDKGMGQRDGVKGWDSTQSDKYHEDSSSSNQLLVVW